MFRTLDDYKKDKKVEKDEKKKNTESYAGGKSGMAIENPNNVDKIVQKAEQQGKESENQSGQKTNCLITLYANGFTLDDGEFRPYNVPENDKFIQELNQEQVPRELRNKFPEGLYVSLQDKRKENYELPPPPKYIAFSGQGQQFDQAVTVQNQPQGISQNKINVDENKPMTTINLRLQSGKTQQIKVNLTTKIQEIYNYIISLGNTQNFQLIDYQRKPITNFTQTVEDAGYEDSTITQR